MTDKLVVLVTCGSAKEAQRIARSVVSRRLAACVNILPGPIHSIYRWKGSVASAEEFLLLVKSSRARFRALQDEIRRLHSYQVPEIIAVPIVKGSRDYLSWISESVRNVRKTKPK
ncbi:MAG: divalent-cation tolerance protein CutA [Candidatus Acidiferrales bacterium]